MSKIKNFKGFSRGFTLTEVLLAVMIVGLIGVSLASLTRAAARESGVGRSKIMLRNNLSMFLRTLREDMAGATRVDYIGGDLGTVSTSAIPLLQIAQNIDGSGVPIVTKTATTSGIQGTLITYCFLRGSDNSGITPSTAYRGGKIYRRAVSVSSLHSDLGNYPTCTKNYTASELVLDNVKYIPGSYPVPLFDKHSLSRNWTNSLLRVNIIVELRSKPVVNDVVEEVFAMPMGY